MFSFVADLVVAEWGDHDLKVAGGANICTVAGCIAAAATTSPAPYSSRLGSAPLSRSSAANASSAGSDEPDPQGTSSEYSLDCDRHPAQEAQAETALFRGSILREKTQGSMGSCKLPSRVVRGATRPLDDMRDMIRGRRSSPEKDGKS